MKEMIKGICSNARAASYELLLLSENQIDLVLCDFAAALEKQVPFILAANDKDLGLAIELGMASVMQDRLRLTKDRIHQITDSLRALANLKSPYKLDSEGWVVENGLKIEKRRVPFGVVGMIYESRPNVTVDAAAIAFKTKNAIVLKGGKEALATNTALVKVLREVLAHHRINQDAISFIETTDREAAAALLEMKGLVDVLIPRGGAALINWVSENSKVPVIETGAGNCHIFVDMDANQDMALRIIENAKVQRPSVCNAVEKVLVHADIASDFIPKLEELLEDRVRFRADEVALGFLKSGEVMQVEEFDREYLDYILGIRVVGDVKEAVTWINQYSTHHSEAIISENQEVVTYFLTMVDSAAVYHNASTRFTDGGEFGFGAEIGIATSKLHARGPMGLEAMTTYKYCLFGSGQVR